MRKLQAIGMALGLLLVSSASADVITGDSIYQRSSDSGPNYNRYSDYAVNGSFDDNEANNPDSSAAGHTNLPGGTMWLTDANDAAPYLIIDLGASYTVASVHVWNYNELDGFSRRGAQQIQILSSGTAMGSYTLRDTLALAQAPGTNGYMGQGLNFTAPFTAQYIRLNITSNYGDSTYSGLSEVEFSTTAVPEPAALGIVCLAALAGLRRRRA